MTPKSANTHKNVECPLKSRVLFPHIGLCINAKIHFQYDSIRDHRSDSSEF